MVSLVCSFKHSISYQTINTTIIMAKLSIGLLLCLALAINVQAKSVTYEGIGTFTDHDFKHPTHRPIVMLPFSPEKINPRFMLYTPKNPHDEEKLYWKDQESIKNSHFDGSLETKFIVHGFIDNSVFGEWMRTLKDQFLANGHYNVIIVDWSHQNNLVYDQEIANCRVVGPMIAIMIQDMVKVGGGTLDNFHILGHSLGSHVAGNAGKFLNGTLGHITGFDPAGPSYEHCPPGARLWHTDAKFVEAIHSDAKALIPYIGLGMYETCAHVDLYPNGGVDQPGCNKERFIDIFIKGLFEGVRRIIACNHQRSVDFYIASLESTRALPRGYLCENYQQYKEGKCTDCGEKGEKCVILGRRSTEWKKTVTDLGQGGKRFFFGTGPDEPYFKYEYAVTIKVAADSHDEANGKVHLQFSGKGGNAELFDFNQKDMKFHKGQTYSMVVALDNDLGEISSIDLHWTHNLNILHHTMFVESIEVVSMSLQETTKSATTNKFCNPKHEGIKNPKHFTFTNRC